MLVQRKSFDEKFSQGQEGFGIPGELYAVVAVATGSALACEPNSLNFCIDEYGCQSSSAGNRNNAAAIITRALENQD